MENKAFMSIHERGLDLKEGEGILTAVDVLILKRNEQGQEEVLLGLRKAKAGEKTWGFPGGHQKTGETIAQTAQRELKEELGENARIIISKEIVSVRENKIHPWYVPHITVIIKGLYEDGEIYASEVERTHIWQWYRLDQLPTDLFSGVAETVENYKQGRVALVTDWHNPK